MYGKRCPNFQLFPNRFVASVSALWSNTYFVGDVIALAIYLLFTVNVVCMFFFRLMNASAVDYSTVYHPHFGAFNVPLILRSMTVYTTLKQRVQQMSFSSKFKLNLLLQFTCKTCKSEEFNKMSCWILF